MKKIHYSEIEIPNGKYAVKKKFIGEWIISETSEWSADFLNLEGKAKIKISSRGTGEIKFGAVHVFIDAMKDEWNPEEVIQFSFEGIDEGDPVSGRGTAKIVNEKLVGRFVFHMGMDSTFTAERKPKK